MGASRMLLLVAALCHGLVSGIIFQLPANQEVCFGEELGYDMVVHGVYKTLSGQARLRVQVLQTVLEDDVAGEPVKIVEKEGREGSFGFTTEKQGEFKFCFLSDADHVDHELEVDMEIKVGFEARDYAEVAKKEHLKPVEVELVRLNDAAIELFHELNSIRNRELDHRKTTDNTNTAVMGWSALSLVIIIVLGVYQTYYLRTYFRRKRLID